ncbi:hypothetical protein GCM10023115_12310 [Pontixanthobacter gangjinensis]|uniref:Uncharacterized protein n=1 Tax=Pontixanthobacter gangjinensis TaxID=1028742 RepID=A0A6I4SL83_9SPHN|nr:nuclear transport factor 2 family protein [Pontixanthobacter gangjinensis]MXO56475.1 hypothetical protein [Pontixanthobacter gangjinensis]
MELYLQNLDNMLAAWNAPDEGDVLKLAETALEHNVHFVDPNHNIMGVEAFVAMVHAVKKQIPGAVYSRTSRVDIQNNHCRYHWAIHMGDKLLMSGFDVTEVNDGGKIVKVIGFFGELSA